MSGSFFASLIGGAVPVSSGRSERARQLTKTFVQRDFEQHNEHAFKRQVIPKNTRFAAMTDFGPDLPHVLTAFPGRDIEMTLT